MDGNSDKPAAGVNLPSAQVTFQADNSTDEELGQQPHSASCCGAPSPTITANPVLSTEFASATGRSSTPLAQSSVPGRSSTSTGRGASAVLNQPLESRQVSTRLNERELRVAPDEHSIISNDLLRCTPYIVNSLYDVLICTDCRHCINPDRASEHLRKHHPHCKVGTGFVSQLNESFPGLKSEEVHPPKLVGPVFGLAIPLDPYVVCARCRRGYVNLNTWRRHTCQKADQDLDGGPERFTSHVQTFFRGPKLCYFPIALPALAPSEPRGDDFDLFMSSHRDPAGSGDDVDVPENYRELNRFLLKEGWIEHLSGYPRSELSILADLPQAEEVLQPVGREVVALMSNIQVAIGMAGYHVRRLLGRRPP
jgi:hypothetical protein